MPDFKIGEKAVYPAQGVAEVVDIEEKDIAGSRQRFYVLRILDTDRKIMVPVKNADAVGLRQVISEQEIQEIFDILRERTIAFDNQTWNRRYRGFMDKIKTGSIYDVAEVLRDLFRLKTDKQLKEGKIKGQVSDVIEQVEGADDLQSLRNLKKLHGVDNYYRIKLGDYRIGLIVEKDVIVFVRLLHRKDIYRYFP